jgi:hypothetical protein
VCQVRMLSDEATHAQTYCYLRHNQGWRLHRQR